MSSEKEYLLLEEEQTVPDDLDFNQDRRHCGNQEYSPLEAQCECKDRHLEHHSVSRLFSVYCFILHLVCVLLGVSLFFTTTAVSSNHPDLAMLGT